MVVVEVDLEWDAGRGLHDLHLRERLPEQSLERLDGALRREDGGKDALGVEVAVAHGHDVARPEQLGEVHGVLLAGDEGEVRREELLDDGRDEHVGAQAPVAQEGGIIDAVRLVVEAMLLLSSAGVGGEDVAVLGALPGRAEHGAGGGEHLDGAAGNGGGLAWLEVGDVREGERGDDGLGVGRGDHGEVRRGGGDAGERAEVAVVVEALGDEEQVHAGEVEAAVVGLERLLGGVEEPGDAEVEVAVEDGVDEDAEAAVQLPQPPVELQVRQLNRRRRRRRTWAGGGGGGLTCAAAGAGASDSRGAVAGCCSWPKR